MVNYKKSSVELKRIPDGSDVDVVNAARQSFGKEVTTIGPKEENLIRYLARGYMSDEWRTMIEEIRNSATFEDAERLMLKFKRRAVHFAPFCHVFLSFRIQCPIALVRQLAKHQIGLTISEESRRYLDTDIDYYMPDEWRSRPQGNIKQGSGESTVETIYFNMPVDEYVDLVTKDSNKAYRTLLEHNVAPEQARFVLPLNSMTTFTWSGSLLAFARVAQLRLDDHAQKDLEPIVSEIAKHAKKYFPVSWKYLVE